MLTAGIAGQIHTRIHDVQVPCLRASRLRDIDGQTLIHTSDAKLPTAKPNFIAWISDLLFVSEGGNTSP